MVATATGEGEGEAAGDGDAATVGETAASGDGVLGACEPGVVGSDVGATFGGLPAQAFSNSRPPPPMARRRKCRRECAEMTRCSGRTWPAMALS
jgi:hypothetical protein